MQGLSDGYFVIPYTLGGYLAGHKIDKVDTSHPSFDAVGKEVEEKTEKLLSIQGNRTVDDFHKKLGKIMWNECGMARSAKGLGKALVEIPALRDEFWNDVKISGSKAEFNQTLEKAGRVADFLEFAETMVGDALYREESCGGHFREEHQTAEGEADRDDDKFSHVAAWEFKGVDKKPELHKEELKFENVKLAKRSYK
jgi:succinate dehydrogenase / fumarate reductase flavoprotein subunit